MKITRREFIQQSAVLSTLGTLSSFSPLNAVNISNYSLESRMIWANLLHVSTNMWEDHTHVGGWGGVSDDIYKDDFEYKSCHEATAWAMRAYRPYLVCDQSVWDQTLQYMAKAGLNMVVIDLGDAIKYESHPEIGVRNAWSVDKLRGELQKIRQLGLEPIPKLNFATSHDAWLGEYERMVSTTKYYNVCRNLIHEVIDLFDNPRFFQLGMDEETANHQKSYKYAAMRQGDLWWHDLFFLVNEVEKRGVRSWVWSDYGWHHPELFFKNMPKSIIQSNWYYDKVFDLKELKEPHYSYVKFYNDMEEHGYDQIPTGSNWSNNTNMWDTVKYGKKNIDSSRLLGFMTAPWLPNLEICLQKQFQAIDQLGNARRKIYSV